MTLDWHSPENTRVGRSTPPGSHWAHVTDVKESGDAMFERYAATIPWLLLGTGMKSWEPLSDRVLVQWAIAVACPDPGLVSPSAISSEACPDVVRSASRHVGTILTTESHYELPWFRFFFTCIPPSIGWWFWFPLTRDFVQWIIQCTVKILNGFVHQDLMSDLSVPLVFYFIFMSSVENTCWNAPLTVFLNPLLHLTFCAECKQ